MLAKTSTLTPLGLKCQSVTVEVDISYGLPNFHIVGLGAAAIQEARERVRGAIKNSKFPFPVHRLTVNLAPAAVRKDGTQFDLAIAIGILQASEVLPPLSPRAFFYGELSLSGQTRQTRGVLPAVMEAIRQGFDEVYVPAANQTELAYLPRLATAIYLVTDLATLVAHLAGRQPLVCFRPGSRRKSALRVASDLDMSMIRGQQQVKRCLEIAATGHHNVLLIGPPGVGKTALARTVPTIMTRLTTEEALEVAQLYSLAGLMDDDHLVFHERPFRAPHHTASAAAIIGGGTQPRPGEVSLAHHGILFLDEIAEFELSVLDVLRQPLEDRTVMIARAAGTLLFPASFMLIAACNPCPCGYYQTNVQPCTCTKSELQRYQKRFSGPLLDRIDLCVTVPALNYHDMAVAAKAESSSIIATRVRRAQAFAGRLPNSRLTTEQLKVVARLDRRTEPVIRQIVQRYRLSPRSFYRVLRVARTIADLAQSDTIQVDHLTEACTYRPIKH